MFESLGVSPGQIMYLGKVGVGVKEQPLVVVEVCAALNQGAFGMGELVDVVRRQIALKDHPSTWPAALQAPAHVADVRLPVAPKPAAIATPAPGGGAVAPTVPPKGPGAQPRAVLPASSPEEQLERNLVFLDEYAAKRAMKAGSSDEAAVTAKRAAANLRLSLIHI